MIGLDTNVLVRVLVDDGSADVTKARKFVAAQAAEGCDFFVDKVVLVEMVWVLETVFGYGRTRRMIERASRRTPARAATSAEIADAQALARLAASAGANTLGEATCLRRALLLHGWLRRRGLRPALLLGLPTNAPAPAAGDFSAHAWVELDGVPLLESDVGYRPVVPASPAPQA